ncbi:hypothetical protein KBY70_04185 [Cyanobium sp. ATX 6E8]|uniref:hypothetical protein n=1 Tax=Cyanobium sp. ATX 6E8 TaxID=2823701 RepID=UPI0020CF094B|nr:hypothetical protein [Cyanobium sp. ATX 6E8]MCP9941597.1 hypothetical protein [Cyanobium sp. ATX 6E8]
MTQPPSFPPPARPDLADRLLAAVAERDQPMAERLVQQWVHRRGLAALDALVAGPLLASQGAEAAQWLQERAGGGAPLGLVPAVLQPEPEWLSESVEQVVEPVVEPIPAAVLSRSWSQLAVVPDGEPAPAPRALAPLRAWLPDADSLPLAS